jgi:hypothetical protein
LINIEGVSFGLEKQRKESIAWLSGQESVDLKGKGALGLKI